MNTKGKEDLIKDKLAKADANKSDVPMVTATKMRMMQTPIPRDGFLLVCPNNKHGHNYGYPGNYSSLSPMKLGPVVDGGEFMACSIAYRMIVIIHTLSQDTFIVTRWKFLRQEKRHSKNF